MFIDASASSSANSWRREAACCFAKLDADTRRGLKRGLAEAARSNRQGPAIFAKRVSSSAILGEFHFSTDTQEITPANHVHQRNQKASVHRTQVEVFQNRMCIAVTS